MQSNRLFRSPFLEVSALALALPAVAFPAPTATRGLSGVISTPNGVIAPRVPAVRPVDA